MQKLTLLELREHYGINIHVLAEAAGVKADTVFAMLVGWSVTQIEAQLVLAGLSELLGVVYTLDDIAVKIKPEAEGG